MAHAYFVAARAEEGIAAAHSFGEKHLGLSPKGNPDVMTLQYGLFPVEEARRIGELASRASVHGKGLLIVIAADRFFHESQNALLKVFEEPPEGTTLILVLPSEGLLLPTLRSRLQELPVTATLSPLAKEFVAKPAGRAKLVEKLLTRARSDKAEEKQEARKDARELIEGIMQAAYKTQRAKPNPELATLLVDLNRLAPVMHDRSAPLKPILEHLLLVCPRSI